MAVTINFTGIVTHLMLEGTPENVPRSDRVVLVRADHGAFLHDKTSIPPHIPMLVIDPKYIAGIDGYPYGLEMTGRPGAWRLCGADLKLENVLPNQPFEPSIGLVPRLSTQQAPGMRDEEILQENIACCMVITSGRLTASQETPKSPVVTTLDVDTTDQPALTVTAFWNRRPCTIRLADGATIGIEHMGYQQGDSANDFLLHYRIFKFVPNDAYVPPESKQAGNSGNISVGCSNSQYP